MKAKKLINLMILKNGNIKDERRVIKEEGVTLVYSDRMTGSGGAYLSVGGISIITISKTLPDYAQKFVAFHELYHHLTAPGHCPICVPSICNIHEIEADTFATRAMIPHICKEDTIESLSRSHKLPIVIGLMRLNLNKIANPIWGEIMRREIRGL